MHEPSEAVSVADVVSSGNHTKQMNALSSEEQVFIMFKQPVLITGRPAVVVLFSVLSKMLGQLLCCRSPIYVRFEVSDYEELRLLGSYAVWLL
jgi:hypothetical protein